MFKLKFVSGLIIVFWSMNSVAQSDTLTSLLSKGDQYLKENNYLQAKYYFKLAEKYINSKSNGAFYEEMVKSRINTVDSLEAYSCTNPEYIALVHKADSLKICCKIAAMQLFEQANKINNSCSYPVEQIGKIIDSSPEVQQKLMVFYAKQRRKDYLSQLEMARIFEQQNRYFKALSIYNYINRMFPEDSVAPHKIDSLQKLVEDEANVLEQLIENADVYYRTGELKRARKAYERAITIDETCNVCAIRLRRIDYLLDHQTSRETDWDQLLLDAESNFDKGNYEMAYYQYLWLHKHDKSNSFVDERLSTISDILADELSEKNIDRNAQLLTEKADRLFMNGDYDKALQVYIKIENRYGARINYLQYITERIAECKAYIAEQEGE